MLKNNKNSENSIIVQRKVHKLNLKKNIRDGRTRQRSVKTRKDSDKFHQKYKEKQAHRNARNPIKFR